MAHFETQRTATFRGQKASRNPVGLFTLLDIWKSRRALAKLDTTALEDIGLTPDQVQKEVRRPLWDVPQNWRI